MISAMTKIIWMTDLHFQAQGTVFGLNPRARLAAAIDHANTHHPDASLTIISGDLVNDESNTNYPALATYLAQSTAPIHPMMGNNDDRVTLRAHLPLPADTMPDFIQYALDTPNGTLICLDTHKIGAHEGELCGTRLDWLDQTLRQTATKPAYIFMHHPPLALAMPNIDEIMLEDADTFLDLISQHTHVKHLFMGHVHRPTTGTIRGIPFATLGAISFQAPAPRPAWTWENFTPPAEPPQYGILTLTSGNALLQYTQFCDHSLGFDPAAAP
jgi:Icc protein